MEILFPVSFATATRPGAQNVTSGVQTKNSAHCAHSSQNGGTTPDYCDKRDHHHKNENE